MAAPTYPINHPTTPNFKTARWQLSRQIAVSESPYSGVQQVYEYDYALWGATLSLPPMRREQAGAWTAFFATLHGRKGTFTLGDPDRIIPLGVATGTITLASGASVGDYSLSLTVGASLSGVSNIFKAGDYIQLGASAANYRLYQVIEDCDASGTSVTAKIEPAVKRAESTGQEITYNSPKGLFRMDTDDLGWETNEVSVYGISFSCTEAL
tara:strand:- start:562 stop:1194 length:633 start_codon:yes stop_codon:yes gene_type:complete